jgi:hypothetical protein
MTDTERSELALRNAEASLRMESLEVSDEAKADCRRLMNGEMTDEQYMDNVRRRYTEYMVM